MKQQPGVVIYYDINDPVKLLTDSERGQLFSAILDYGEKQIIPQFTGQLAIVWGFIRPKIDRDAETYRIKALKNQHAVYCRLSKERSQTPVSREMWMTLSDEVRDQLISGDIDGYPTTTASAAAYTTAATTSYPSISTAATDKDDAYQFAVTLMDRYPVHRRGDPNDVLDAVRCNLTSYDDFGIAVNNLDDWIASMAWHKDGGQYIPSLSNWLRNGMYRHRPTGPRADGRRPMSNDELYAVDQLFAPKDQ